MIRSVVCPMSVGREAPLRSLLERLDRAVEGHGTVLFLGGDAGVGKSRLVRDLKQEATARHIRVIEGRSVATEGYGENWADGLQSCAAEDGKECPPK